MKIKTEVDNGGERFLINVQKRIHGWEKGAIGVVALDFADYLKPWVYREVEKRSGGLERAMGAFLKNPKKKRGEVKWVIGANDTKYNYMAKWIPSSPTFAKNGSKDRDFLHHAWASYTAQHNIQQEIQGMIGAAIKNAGDK